MAVCLCAWVPALQGATIIDTTPAWHSSVIGNLGLGFYRAMGQTFTVSSPDVFLTEFSLFVEGGGTILPPLTFVGVVMEWTGTSATGSPLYQSAIQSTDLGTPERFTFHTGAVHLPPGKEYVAFVDTAGANSFGLLGITSGINSYLGGGFVGATVLQSLTDPWYIGPGGSDTVTGAESDAAFIAKFAKGSELPVPGTLTLMWLALAILCAAQFKSRQ